MPRRRQRAWFEGNSFMCRSEFRWIFVAIACASQSPTASAACAVFGDSIGVGLGAALKGACSTSAQIGILSNAVAARVTPGDRWAIVSLGSNDFPAGLSPLEKSFSERRVERSLDDVDSKVGKRLILILPANEARSMVSGWASRHGVPTVSFIAGPDGIHPKKAEYNAMAQKLLMMTK